MTDREGKTVLLEVLKQLAWISIGFVATIITLVIVIVVLAVLAKLIGAI